MYKIDEDLIYIGQDDPELEVFENQYDVKGLGVTYNSYLIKDEKNIIFDGVDIRKAKEWLSDVKELMGNDSPDYLVVSHMEPDHSASIRLLAEAYPEMKLIGNAQTFKMLNQFFNETPIDPQRFYEVKENDELSTGKHNFRFIFAPFIHWPEVMMTYETNKKLLFSADGFGRFGSTALTANDPWTPEARRYYFNIVGKYGTQVQSLLKKVGNLEINKILPLHGPIIDKDLAYYVDKYDKWSSYVPEEKEAVLVAYASIHGNTAKAAKELIAMLREAGVKTIEADLSKGEKSPYVDYAFYAGKMVLMSPTYDSNIFPPVEEFIEHLRNKNYQNRTVALIENGSWGPMANRLMKDMLKGFKNINLVDKEISIRSALSGKNREEFAELVNILKN